MWGFNFAAISLTENLTTVAVGTQLMPPMSAILSLLFFHESISYRKWFGILIATCGAVYLAGATQSSLSVIFYSESISLSLVTGGSVILVGVWVQQIGIGRTRRGTPLP